MTWDQATGILKPEGSTLEAVKAAYRTAALKYHPDRNPNGLEMMKLINLAFELLKKNLGKWDCRNRGEAGTVAVDEAIQAVFDKIKHFVGIRAEICGCWLWFNG